VYALAFVGEGAEADRVVVALWDGREMPDVDPDTTWPGGPGTTHDLVLPLPDGRAVTAAWDVDGQDLPLPPAGPVVSLTLTISPVYLELGSLSL
jgi:hypothetical protein